jgi:anthranilate synthase component II
VFTTHEERSVSRVLMVDHYDSYTWNLVHLIAAVSGHLPAVAQHDQVHAADVLTGGYSHIVLSPGPGDPRVPNDFDVGRELLLRSDIPVLGVCLGMQGLVAAYGGAVARIKPSHGDVAVVHHYGRQLFADIPTVFEAVRYHSLGAVALPPDLRETAWCYDDGVRVVMAVEHVTRPLWGVQFHPESIGSQYGHRLISNFLSRT